MQTARQPQGRGALPRSPAWCCAALCAAAVAGHAAGPSLAAPAGDAVDALRPATPWRAIQVPFTPAARPDSKAEPGTDRQAILDLGVGPLTAAPPAAASAGPWLPGATGAPGATAAAPAEAANVIAQSAARERMYEGLVDVQDKNYAKAIPKLEWVIEEDPTLLEAWEALGWSYFHLGQKDKTRALWERLAVLAADRPMPYNLLAQLATAEPGVESLRRAAGYFRKSLELNPKQYEIRFYYAQNLLWRGFLAESIGRLRDLLKEDPDRLDVRIELARALFADQHYEESLDHWARIRAAAPDNLEFLLAEAQALLYVGDLELADERANQALALDSGNARAVALLADIAEYARQPRQALAELRRLADLTVDPAIKSTVLQRLAWRRRLLFEEDAKAWPLADAIACAREALDADRRSVAAHLFLAELLLLNRGYRESEALCRTVLRDFNAHNLRAQKTLFELQMAQGRLEEAEGQLLTMISGFNPRDPFRHLLQARLEFASGDFYGALQSLDRLEAEGARGAVLVLLYHGLSPSEWLPMTSIRRFREHLLALQRAGFRFVSADRIPAYFASRPPPPAAEPPPWPHRLVRAIHYAFTGLAETNPPTLRELTPDKMVCVTFDDTLRTSFTLGTPVAEELGTAFAMHIPVGNILRHDIGFCSWEEQRQYQESGQWVLGSHLLEAHFLQPIAADGTRAYPLPNRIWLPARNRLETLRAYYQRVRREFQESRAVIARELALGSNDCRFVAYPYGDIGQEDRCNIQDAAHPMKSILNEASLVYTHGFIQSEHGYAIASDNPMLLPRYEPGKQASGREVLHHAFEHHPVFLARRMRAEIAALQGKPYLAQQMLDELERDGYPDDLLKDLARYVKDHLARKVAGLEAGDRERDRAARPLVDLSQPTLGVEAYSTRANVQLEQWGVLGKAGLNLNPALSLEGRAGYGRIRQTLKTNVWKEIEIVKETTTRQRIVSTTDGQTTVTDEDVTTWEPQTVQTNIVKTDVYKSEETDLAGQLNLRFRTGALALAEFTARRFSGDLSNRTEYCWAAEYQWKPTLALDASARYEHDVIPSAHSLVTYHSGALMGVWRVRDWWDLLGSGRFAYLSDNNSLLNLTADSSWLVSERQGLYLGLQALFITTDKADPYYWTPYWEQRYYLFAKLQRNYPTFYAEAMVRVGQMTAKAREADMEAYQALRAQGAQQGWYPGESPDPGWEPIIGASATVRKTVWRFWDVFGTFSVDALRDYTEHTLRGGLALRL